MPDKKEMTRREALKTITVGAGVVVTLPVLGGLVKADDDMAHMHMHGAAGAVPAQEAAAKPYKLKFFTPEENRLVVEMSDRIIPTDGRSPGAKAAKVNEYIDTRISEEPEPIRKFWKDGLSAVEKKCKEMYGKSFADASQDQQVAFLKEISKHEAGPQTIEEHFFTAIKNSTIDGYYTSSIGIHQDLHYKGNTYLRKFVGCTDPEHMKG